MRFRISDSEGNVSSHPPVDRVILSLNSMSHDGASYDPEDWDGVIIAVPPECWQRTWRTGIDAENRDALLLPVAAEGLIGASEAAAGQIGKHLHHAEWMITGNKDMVKEAGLAHGCPTCIAQTDQALAHLREHPEDVIACGQLWWCEED